jgi:hypothetical protein
MTGGFEPQWSGVFENWTRAYIKVHGWKIRQEMEAEDAVQEGARIFTWCLRKTTAQGGRIDNEKWFMTYYQRALVTWLIDAAAKTTARRDALAILAQQPPVTITEPNGPLLATLSQDASHELQTIIKTIAGTPSEYFLRLMLNPGDDHDWSRRMCRLCGLPANKEIIAELRRLLQK